MNDIQYHTYINADVDCLLSRHDFFFKNIRYRSSINVFLYYDQAVITLIYLMNNRHMRHWVILKIVINTPVICREQLFYVPITRLAMLNNNNVWPIINIFYFLIRR